MPHGPAPALKAALTLLMAACPVRGEQWLAVTPNNRLALAHPKRFHSGISPTLCRVSHEGGMHPGQVRDDFNCWYSYGGKGFATNAYEVVVNVPEGYRWIRGPEPSEEPTEPMFQVGRENDGRPLYLCLGSQGERPGVHIGVYPALFPPHGETVYGKFTVPGHQCIIEAWGGERISGDFFVLVFPKLAPPPPPPRPPPPPPPPPPPRPPRPTDPNASANTLTLSMNLRFGLAFGINMQGQVLLRAGVQNAAECRDECARNPLCNSFVLRKDVTTPIISDGPGACLLNGDRPGGIKDLCCISGARRGVVTEPKEGTRSGLQTAYLRFGATLPADCYERCKQDANCTSYVYDKTLRVCALHNAIPPITRDPNSVQGMRF